GRVAIGTSIALLPGWSGGRWIGDVAREPAVKVALRAFGARDAAIGIGLWRALDEGRPARPWVEAGMLSDAVDAAATLVAIRHVGVRRALPVLAVAVGATVAGARLAPRVD